jgi:two-component system sensor histidine kinase CreC
MGTSFAQWRDVVLALRGEYGARTTHAEGAPCSSMYLSVPVWVQQKVQGVVTVVKPNCLGNELIAKTKSQIVVGASLVFTGAGIAAIVATVIITRPLRRLTTYVRALRDGKPASVPVLPPGELQELGGTIAELRTALDGSHRIDRYARTISHELKSPITAIRGSVEVLREASDIETRDRFLTNIERETSRMYNLIESLVTINSLPLAPDLCGGERLKLSDVVEECINELKPLADSRGISIHSSVSPQSDLVGNRFWLSEVLRNVIRNGVEFAPSTEGVVSIGLTNEKGFLVCRIADNGPGIPDWALPKIFDQFFSLPRPNQNRRSSGLGLSIAREVIERMHGTISVRNQEEGGAEVVIRLRNGKDSTVPDTCPPD